MLLSGYEPMIVSQTVGAALASILSRMTTAGDGGNSMDAYVEELLELIRTASSETRELILQGIASDEVTGATEEGLQAAKEHRLLTPGSDDESPGEPADDTELTAIAGEEPMASAIPRKPTLH
jgi:hypothetical protein